MTERQVSKRLNNITNEVLSIQCDTSMWLSKIKDPQNVDIDMSAILLLSRCDEVSKKINKCQENTNNEVILTILLHNQVMVSQTVEKIKKVKDLLNIERNGIRVSNKTVDIAELEEFKKKIAAGAKLDGEK